MDQEYWMRLRDSYKGRIPVKVIPHRITIDKEQYLFPEEVSFDYVRRQIRKHIQLKPEQIFFILINNYQTKAGDKLKTFDTQSPAPVILHICEENFFGHNVIVSEVSREEAIKIISSTRICQ